MGAAIRGPDGLIDLGAEPLTIGRSRNNRLVLTNSQISAKHAEIQPLPGGRYQVVDLGSSNGTAVNGVKLNASQPQPLNAGDTITLGGSGGVDVRFELSADAPWQANPPQVAAAPGGFGVNDPAAPPAQPFGGGIGQPPPGPAVGFPPAPGAFGPQGQPPPGAPQFPPPPDPFAGPQPGFPPPNQFGPPGSQPAAGPNFPPPGGSGTADFMSPAGAPPAGFPPPGGPGAAPFGAPPAAGPNFPPPGGPQFGPPGGPPAPGGFPPPGSPQFAPLGGPPAPGGFPPPGSPGAAPFGGPQPGGPGYPPGPGFAPGGPPPAKKRGGRRVLLLVGSIILLILIIVGIVFGARLFLNKKKSSVPSPTLTQRSGAHVWVVPAALESSLLLSVKGSQGQYAHSQMIMRVEGSTALAVIHFL